MYLLSVLLTAAAVFCSAAYSGYKWGWKTLITLIPVFAAVLWFNAGSLSASFFFIVLILAGGFCGLAVSGRTSLTVYTAVTGLLAVILFSGDFYYSKYCTGTDYFEESQGVILQLLDQYQTEDSVKEQIKSVIPAALDTLKKLFPFLVFLETLMVSAVLYLLGRIFFRLIKIPMPEKGLPEFDLNGYFVFGLIGSWAGFLLLKNQNELLSVICLNAGLIISVLYFVQGLGIVSFFMRKKGYPGFIIIVLTVLLLTAGGFSIIAGILLSGLGLTDLWADFRKIRPVKQD